MNLPTEIEWIVHDTVFKNEEKGTEDHLTTKAKIYRTADSYIDITELRISYANFNFATFKKFSKLEEEVGAKLTKVVTEGTIRKTYVHERILETVLRWYELDEINIIDKFVNPLNRKIICSNKYGLEILMDMESEYINATELMKNGQLTGNIKTKLKEWTRLAQTRDDCEIYCRRELDITVDDPMEHVFKKGIGYNSKDVWIPRLMLQHIITWTNREYAYMSAKVMDLLMFNKAKFLKVAVDALDTENNTITNVIIQTTSKDNTEEAAQNVKNAIEYVIKDAKGKDENTLFQDDKGNTQSEKEFRETNAKYIQSLKGRIQYFSGMNTALTMRVEDMEEQLAPVRLLLSDHPGADVAQLALTRKEMLDKNLLPLEMEIAEKNLVIQALNEKLKAERKEKDDACEELSIVQGTHEEEMLDLNEYIQQLEEGATKKTKKGGGTAAKKNSSKGGYSLSESKSENSRPTDITSAVSVPCSHLSIYTKRDYEGNHFALVPGRSTNFKGFKFTYRGIITLDEKRTAIQYLELFVKNNRTAYKKYKGLTFITDQTSDYFEQVFSLYFKEEILTKQIADGNPIKKGDIICCY